jgi:hypothetical protein
MNRLQIAAVAGALSIAGATPLAAAAAAGSQPADKQYGNPIRHTTSGGDVAGRGNQVGTVQGNDLPFTGFDAGLVVVGGLTLVGLGLGLRRVSRRSSH